MKALDLNKNVLCLSKLHYHAYIFYFFLFILKIYKERNSIIPYRPNLTKNTGPSQTPLVVTNQEAITGLLKLLL